MGHCPTDQELFWAGDFGTEYTRRNTGPELISRNVALFSLILRQTSGIRHVLELGANIGLNLHALKCLIPDMEATAVEINTDAVKGLKQIPWVEVHECSLVDFLPGRTWDLVLTKGVLIHLDPSALPRAYDVMYRACHRYLCLAEYYNPSPVDVAYRGHTGKLYKRDFAGELLDRFGDLRLVSYGFVYHRDPVFPQDDVTWFLLAKGTAG